MKKRSRHNRPRCMWYACTDHFLVSDDILMCWKHARVIHARVQRSEEITEQRMIAAIERNEERQVAIQVELAKAGKPQRTDIYYQAPPNWVYYIETDGHIKIGHTTDLNGRLKSYPPTAQILGVEYGDRDLERQRHEQFNAYLAYGREWFHDTQEIRDHIATLPPMTHLNIKRMRRGQANQASRIQPRYWTGK